MQKLTPCLWFDTEGEEAATFYTSVFPNSRIVDIARYGSAGPRPEGTVMTVSFELDGQAFLALNGGPEFTFNEAISFQVSCETQDEVDAFWSALSEGGEEGPCGWLKDRFGVSWQIVPTALPRLLGDPDPRDVAARHAGNAEHEEDRDRRARAGRGGGVDLRSHSGKHRRPAALVWQAPPAAGRRPIRPAPGRMGRSARGRTRFPACPCRSRTSPCLVPASGRPPRRRAP